MSKVRTVSSYPHWKQIQFDDCTKDRRELKLTEKLLSAEVKDTAITMGNYFRLCVKGNYKDYI